jgi:Tol biopolymer transport system component
MTMLESFRILCGAGCAIVTGLMATSRVAERTGEVLPGASMPQIAFASHRDGNWEIYLTDIDGQHQTRLTRRDPQDRFPLWSPDRSQIAFGSQVGGDHWELWVMNVDGTNPRPLATQIVAKGLREWSHGGTRIVFAAKVEGDVDIFSVEVASGRVIRLTNSPGEDGDPSWSPDDSHIVFSSTRDGNAEIYVMRADGTDARRLTNYPAPDGSPAWSPDGSKIAFVSTRDGHRDVYLVRVDDERLERLTIDAHATNDRLRWSPDGSHIAVQTADRDNYDIQLVRMADHERRTVAGTPAFDGQYSWSPEGDQLAFISERDGFDAVYVTDLTGKQRRLTMTPSLNPEWSP